MSRSGGEPIPAGRAIGGMGPARFRERFLQGEPVETGVRTPILNSWQRCRTLGLSPDQSDLPFQDIDPDGRIVRAAVPVLDRLQARFAGSAMNISVADASGTVLLRRFGEASLATASPRSRASRGSCSPSRSPVPTASASLWRSGSSSGSTVPNTSPSAPRPAPAARFPFATRSAVASRASCASAIRAVPTTRRWSPCYARRPGPSSGGCWGRVPCVSALCCGRTWPPEPKPPPALTAVSGSTSRPSSCAPVTGRSSWRRPLS